MINDTITPKPGSAANQKTEVASDGASCSPSSDSSVGKSFTMIGYGGPRLRKRVKTERLVLWSISQAKGCPDEFTYGWSGRDPGQLYFVENAESIHHESKPNDHE